MKKTLLFALAFVVLAACRPISRGPSPYQPPSPLAFVSPLYARGAAPAIEQIRMAIAPVNEWRAGTIPAPLFTRSRVYLPIVGGPIAYPCNAVPMAAALTDLILNHPDQQRIGAYCSSQVTAIAQMLADDMATREYYSHVTPESFGPNHWLFVIGCLPPSYPENGNTTQSIALNYFTPERVLAAWLASKSHRAHVLGLHPTYAAQLALGSGVRVTDWGGVWVFMSTEKCG